MKKLSPNRRCTELLIQSQSTGKTSLGENIEWQFPYVSSTERKLSHVRREVNALPMISLLALMAMGELLGGTEQ